MSERRKTSESHPLRVDAVRVPDFAGTVGITFCPGKQDDRWCRSLQTDVDTLRDWGASAVLTLIEDHEFEMLGVPQLGDAITRNGIAWHHLPIRDVDIPDHRFEVLWPDVSSKLRALLREGRSIVVHCRGGLGRAGTVAALLLIDCGMDAAAAVALVRRRRPGSIETSAQEVYIRRYRLHREVHGV
jgi:ADP-ribosyl-[dinitrogen reductase] hydrolase